MKLHIKRSNARKSKGQWYWTIVASNGKKLATSGETYRRRPGMLRILGQLFPQAFDCSGKITVVDAGAQ